MPTDPFDRNPLRAAREGLPEAPPAQPTLFWVGLVLFALPFFAVPLAMVGFLVPPVGALGIVMVPCAFILAVVGMALMIISSIRASHQGGAGRGPNHGRPDGRWSMRGDHAGEIHVEDEIGSATGSTSRVAAPRETDRRCDHCGMTSAATGRGCPRCGAPFGHAP